VDLLEEDKPIAGQKFACLSFVSPEHILEQKEHFYFREFLKVWEFNKAVEKYTQFINFVAYKYNLDFNKLSEDLQAFVKEEKPELLKTSIADEYKTFVDNHEEQLEAEFNSRAELRCKLLREVDPNHDVYVGPVGMWMPFHPEAYKTGRVEYMEETLNQLMNEKKTNEEKAKQEFDKRVKDAKQKAMEENQRNAEKSGNKLTQTLTKEGELVNVAHMNDDELFSTSEQVRKQLFEGENIVTSSDGDHGLSGILERQKQRQQANASSTKDLEEVD